MERKVITDMPLKDNAISIVLLSFLCLDPPLVYMLSMHTNCLQRFDEIPPALHLESILESCMSRFQFFIIDFPLTALLLLVLLTYNHIIISFLHQF